PDDPKAEPKPAQPAEQPKPEEEAPKPAENSAASVEPQLSGSPAEAIKPPVQEEKPAAEEKMAVEAAQPAEEKPTRKEQPAEAESRRSRPAASASPEGSSAPSLLPPVPERESSGAEGEERRERRGRRHEQAQPAPQVRVISRPDTAPARPAQPADRGDREERRKESRPGNARPSSRGGGFAQPAGAAPDISRDGQSKKKRNKNQNRRSDFQQNEIGGMGRHREEDVEEMPRMRGRRRPKAKETRQAPQTTQPLKAAKRKIRVEEGIRVADLAHQMGLKSGEIIKVLFGLGVMATINQTLDIDTAAVVASEFGYEVEKVGFVEEDYLEAAEEDAPESLVRRPPVVTIMGHVDHGKTSLLDAIRKTNVTGGEAGGITQHIGAYYVKTRSGNIVFLDTPGHEAFTAMRARGAQVTDLVVLVVAADDGVMEQTREAVNHSRAAGVPIMVAVNKIDKPEANPDRVLRELAEIGLVPEEWGGDTVVAKVSAKTRQGLDELLELLALQAEILDLKANPNKPARGHIVEAKLDKGRGPIATVLIQEGTLHQGDSFVCGVFSGRARALFNDQGRKVKDAGPSCPVEVQGFEGVPEAGEAFICLTDEKVARRIAESRAVKQRERELAKESRVTLETFLSQTADDGESHTLNLVVKADVQGSLEAIIEALNKQSTDKVKIQVIHGGTGAITESDILLASASGAIIIGFNVRPAAKVKDMAEHENVDIRFYDIIYKLVDEIKSAMAGLLAPVSREEYLGQADVRKVYTLPKVGAVAGCLVSDGKVTRNAGVRLLRDSVVVYTGRLASLKRFKDDVREVLKGYECGMSLENFNDIKMGDVLEFFETVTEEATL
ncbi:MAG: translation initiation factor IF-2, partial [Desulfovibrionaceae bacterium]|nr:translation initiation factor IF-2 [Desulfovibrionaceae bacterium]